MKDRDELHILCDAAVEERLTPEQQRRLEELVLSDPAARRYYVEYLHQHGALHWSLLQKDEGATRPAPTPETTPAPVILRPQFNRRRVLTAVAAAAAVLVALGLWVNARASALAVATLTGGKSCKWDAGTLPTEEGAKLGSGRLRLAEGIARITFASGAEVTLEAPAELELVSPKRCVLHGGRLIAKVPPQAIGFVVDTPTAVLHDLGTEFGVNVRDNQADVQVFNGIVDVKHRASGQTERLLTGRNRRFGTADAADFDPQLEKPLGGTGPTIGAGARVVQLSTAMGRGKDRYVQPLFPSPNSSNILLLVKNSSNDKSDYNRKAYIGMDLASVAGNKVTDAQLSFTFTPTGMGFASEVPDATFAVYGLTDESLDDWDEAAMRWNTAPANLPGGSALDPDKVVLLGKFEIAQGALEGTRSITGPALADFLNRNTNGLATFILIRETRGSGRSDLVHGFAGKHHPRLPFQHSGIRSLEFT